MTTDVLVLTNAYESQNCIFAPEIEIGPLSAWDSPQSTKLKLIPKRIKLNLGINAPSLIL